MPGKKEFLTGGLYAAAVTIGILVILGVYEKNMTVLPILEEPEPVLRQVSEPIQVIDEQVILLANAIISTLRYRTLVDFFLERAIPRGLAAPQVGVPIRLIVCGVHGSIKVMINPVILERKGTYEDVDGCLSVRTGSETVINRSAYVKVQYRTLDNRVKILKVKNDYAALVEHEVDHLNGVLNTDY